jgi:protein SCO1/2
MTNTDSKPSKSLHRLLLIAGAISFVLTVVALVSLRGLLSPTASALAVYAELPDFHLTNRDGRAVSKADLEGKPFVADFIFTRCAGICPAMSAQMSRLAGELDPEVNLVSISVDPEHDTPEVLAEYAGRFDAPERWYFLTGERDAIHSLSREGFLLGLEVATPESPTAEVEPIVHSNRFVLVDRAGRIRGYYNAFDAEALDRLTDDAERVTREST